MVSVKNQVLFNNFFWQINMISAPKNNVFLDHRRLKSFFVWAFMQEEIPSKKAGKNTSFLGIRLFFVKCVLLKQQHSKFQIYIPHP